MRVCRACDLPDAPKTFEAIERSIFENNMLPPERMADYSVYLARVEKCLSCSKRMEVTCMECGCFVQLRAMDKQRSCPNPEGSRW